MYVCICVYIYMCMYVCVYIYIYICIKVIVQCSMRYYNITYMISYHVIYIDIT